MKNLGFYTALIFGGMISLSYLGFNLKYETNEFADQLPVMQQVKQVVANVDNAEEAVEFEATGLEAQGAFEEEFPGNVEGANDPGVVTVEEDDSEDPKKMTIQTRPGLDIINLSFKSDKVEMITLEVFDQSGKKVLSRNTQTQIGENSYFFNLEYVSSGIYLVTASTADWSNTRKVYKYDLI